MRLRRIVAVAASAALAAAAAATSPVEADPRTRAAIQQLRTDGAIGAAAHRRARVAYDRAIAAVDRLRGGRQRAMRGALAEVDAIARSGRLSSSRLRLIRLTLDRNRHWWTRRPMLPVGARLDFGRSELLWQHYAGRGLQVQWLATFSKANSLWRQHMHKRLRRLLDTALEFAVPRGPGIAWEYQFTFANSRPPWVSGLAQGTALTALTRAARTLGVRRYARAAHAALGIFRVAPPTGVRVRTVAGAHYAQYSGNPQLRVLNGFVQSLNGLSDLSRFAGGRTKARWLLERGDAEALRELPRYVSGGWSRYSSDGRFSTLGYQRVLRNFVRARCDRGGNRKYCRYAERLSRQLRRAPRLQVVASRRAHRQRDGGRLLIALDKPAATTTTVTGRRFRQVVRASLLRGKHVIRWKPPRAGPFRVTVVAVDYAGNRRSRRAVLHLRP